MQQQDVLQSLASLEKSLADVSSAADMVRSTTAAYDAVKDSLQSYADTLSGISSQIAGILKDVTSSHEASSRTVQNRINTTLQQLDDAIDALKGTGPSVGETVQKMCDAVEKRAYATLQRLDDAITSLSNTRASLDKSAETLCDHVKDSLQQADSRLHAATDDLRATEKNMIADISAELATWRQTFDAQHKVAYRRLNFLLVLQLIGMALSCAGFLWLLRYGMTGS